MTYLANESWVSAIRRLTKNGSDCVQIASPFFPEVVTESHVCEMLSLTPHVRKFPSFLKAARWNRAYNITYILKFKYTSQRADPMGELSSQPVRSTTESTFLKHNTPHLSSWKIFILSFLKLCFSLAFFRYCCQCNFTTIFGSEYSILNSSCPHKTNKLKEKQKTLYLLSFFSTRIK